MPSIGFIGLGNMGAHMARNLLKNGKKLVVYDSVAASMNALKSDGAVVASSPAEVALGCSVVVTMLPSSPHVLDVYAGPKGIFKKIAPNTLCIDSSTIDPAVSVQMANSAKAHKSTYLDAPVSGGVVAAQNAGLTFMVGGCADGYARAEPLLKLMGKNVVHTGASGTGQAAKICNNMLLAIGMIGTSEAMHLGQTLGLDAKMLAKIINMSSGRCWSSELYNPVPGVVDGVPSGRDYAGGFGSALMAKDLGLAQNASTATQAPTPLGSLAHQIYRLLAQHPDYANKDFSVVYQMLKKKT